VTEKAKETNQQEEISDVLLTRSLGRFVGVLGLLPSLRRSSFQGCRLRDGRTWREGILSLKHRRCNETKEYHRAQQSPHENDWLPGNENPHGRTSGDEERLTITAIMLRILAVLRNDTIGPFFLGPRMHLQSRLSPAMFCPPTDRPYHP
jgi:hypothetical protein